MGTLKNNLRAAVDRLAALDVTPKTDGFSETAQAILARLRNGQGWLTEQHQLYLADDPAAASDERFCIALATWEQLERVFRCTGYQGCIWGPDVRCPDDAPVNCNGCLTDTPPDPELQLSLLERHGH